MNVCVGVVSRSDRELAALTAVHHQYIDEIAKLRMQLLRYRESLVARGIDPPDLEGQDLLSMWEACRTVISAAHGCLADLGTSKELLVPFQPR